MVNIHTADAYNKWLLSKQGICRCVSGTEGCSCRDKLPHGTNASDYHKCGCHSIHADGLDAVPGHRGAVANDTQGV